MLESDLYYAALEDNLEVMRNLLKDDSELAKKTNHVGISALHIAAKKGNIDAACLLIINGADVNAKTIDEKLIPLDFAVNSVKNERCSEKKRIQSEKVIECLIKEGSIVTSKMVMGVIFKPECVSIFHKLIKAYRPTDKDLASKDPYVQTMLKIRANSFAKEKLFCSSLDLSKVSGGLF